MKIFKVHRAILATVAFAGIITPIQALAATVTLLPTKGIRIGNYPYGLEPGYLSVYNNGGGNIQNSIMRFEFSSVPNYAVINSAVLTLTSKDSYAQQSGTHSDVFAIADQWDINANWNYATSITPWSTPGGDVTGATYATNFETIIPVGAVAVTWEITSLISQWTSGALVNNGLMLKGSVGNQLHFYPIDEIDSSYVPKLSITYTIPEPSALFLSGVFVLGLLCKRRRTDVTD